MQWGEARAFSWSTFLELGEFVLRGKLKAGFRVVKSEMQIGTIQKLLRRLGFANRDDDFARRGRFLTSGGRWQS
jgi:hypothetical protein